MSKGMDVITNAEGNVEQEIESILSHKGNTNVVPLVVLRWASKMERFGLVEQLTRTVPTIKTPNTRGGGWGSRGEIAATCV